MELTLKFSCKELSRHSGAVNLKSMKAMGEKLGRADWKQARKRQKSSVWNALISNARRQNSQYLKALRVHRVRTWN